jgi:hypothetical protein
MSLHHTSTSGSPRLIPSTPPSQHDFTTPQPTNPIITLASYPRPASHHLKHLEHPKKVPSILPRVKKPDSPSSPTSSRCSLHKTPATPQSRTRIGNPIQCTNLRVPHDGAQVRWRLKIIIACELESCREKKVPAPLPENFEVMCQGLGSGLVRWCRCSSAAKGRCVGGLE